MAQIRLSISIHPNYCVINASRLIEAQDTTEKHSINVRTLATFYTLPLFKY
jgi:hypothetical protein